MRNAYSILVEKHEEKRPLRRPGGRMIIDLREVGWEGVGRIWLRIGTSNGLL
jgi:hypothetical protein